MNMQAGQKNRSSSLVSAGSELPRRSRSVSGVRGVTDGALGDLSVVQRTDSVPRQGSRKSLPPRDRDGMKGWSSDKAAGVARTAGSKERKVSRRCASSPGLSQSGRETPVDKETDETRHVAEAGVDNIARRESQGTVLSSADSEIPKEEADTQMGLALPDASLLRKTMGDALSGTMKALASVTNQGFQWQPATGGQGSPPVEKLAVKLQMRRGRHRRSYSDVDKLEDILMWTDAWRTGKAFGVGLYALICVKVYLDSGIHVIQPSTAAAGIALCVLIYHSILKAAPQLAIWSSSEDDDLSLHNEHGEAVLLRSMSGGIRAVGNTAAVALPPFAALPCRYLTQPRGAPTFYLGLCLWLIMLVGELKLLFQTTLLIVIWIGLFTLPLLYVESRWLLDSLVETGSCILKSALTRHYRPALYMALTAGFATVWLLDVTFVVRTTVGMLVAGGVLVWRVIAY